MLYGSHLGLPLRRHDGGYTVGSALGYRTRHCAPTTCPDHVMTCPILKSARPSPKVLSSEWVRTVGYSRSRLTGTPGSCLASHTCHGVPARAYTWPRLYQLLRGSVRPRRDRLHKTRLMPTGGRRVGSNKALAATYVPAIVLPARPPPDSRSGNEAG